MNLRGLETLQSLRARLNEYGIALVLQCDPTLSVYWQGDMPLEDIPSVIRSQTGMVVIRRGVAWICSDAGGDQVVVSARPGEDRPAKLMSKMQASNETAMDLYLGSLSNVSVDLVVVEAGGGVVLNQTMAAASLDALGAKIMARTVEGGRFSVRDTEDRMVQQPVIVGAGSGGTPVNANNGFASFSAGLIFEGQARNLGGKWELNGKLEISRFTNNINKTQRSFSIEILMERGQAVKVAELNSADLSVQMQKAWGLSGNARTVHVYCRLR